jgi:pyruvate,orthophosphate dikinase
LTATDGDLVEVLSTLHAAALRPLEGVDVASLFRALEPESARLPAGVGRFHSRHPATGEARLTGVFLAHALRSPGGNGAPTGGPPVPLSQLLARPVVASCLQGLAAAWERCWRDMAEIFFAFERGQMFVLGARVATRSPRAAVKIAVDMVGEGLIERAEAVRRVPVGDVHALMAAAFPAQARQQALSGGRLLARGVHAHYGAASGQVALGTGHVIETLMQTGTPQILLCRDVVAREVVGFYNAAAVVAVEGDRNCPAALAARKWGVPCVVGAGAISIDEAAGTFRVGSRTYAQGHWISVDGTSGEIFSGPMPVETPAELPAELAQLLAWADEVARIRVQANADSPDNVAKARRWGAVGIGLCRTERVINRTDRSHLVYPIILTAPEAEALRRESPDYAESEVWTSYVRMLGELEPLLRGDFVALLEKTEGCPITIRLLDAPLNTFLPSYEDMLVEVLGGEVEGHSSLFFLGRDRDSLTLADKQALLARIRRTQPKNPSFGLRVCRQGITYPEIYRMQLRALFEAACDVGGVRLQIMVPGVAFVTEMRAIRELIDEAAGSVCGARGVAVDFRVGTMIELPRACLQAAELAQCCDFFWCGTNDLTQAVCGMSGYDAPYSFLPVYLEKGVLAENPFEVLDMEGVGVFLRMAVQQGKGARPGLEIGICGDQGGEPRGIRFCNEIGMDFVSCDVRRVPAARLAAGQAAVSSNS